MQDIKIAYQAKNKGLFKYSINRYAKKQLIIITLKHVIINIGYAFPRPCITLLQIIVAVTKGIAKENILKYSMPIFIISKSLVNNEKIYFAEVKNKNPNIHEIAIAFFKP